MGMDDITARVFQVLLSKKAGVESALAALAKRCARRGLPTIDVAWGKAYTRRAHLSETVCMGAGCRGCSNIARIPLTLTGDAPKYAGWTLVAALTHVEGETVVRGASVPEMYRTRGSSCDHCKTSRQRAETYLVRHDDGRMMQVGSDCLHDFLGHEEAEKIALQATMLYLAYGAAEDGEEGFGGGQRDHLTLDEYLPMVAWCVRVEGWVSRTAARERDMGAATADRALMYLGDAKARKEAGADPTSEDAKLAADASLWAEALTDAQVSGENDYLHNLRVVARCGYVTNKLAGVGASMITAYERHLGRERAKAARALLPPSTHVGTLGVRGCWSAVLDFVTGYETDYGYTTVLKFRTDDGAVVVWKASSTGVTRADVGKRYMVSGSVKAHADYKGEAQTIVSRAAAREFVQAEWEAHCIEELRKDLAVKVKAGTATDAERAQYKQMQTSQRAATTAKRARVQRFMAIDGTPVVSPVGCNGVAVTGRDITVYYDDRYDLIAVHHGRGERLNRHFSGAEALTKSRKFVAELLAEEVAA